MSKYLKIYNLMRKYLKHYSQELYFNLNIYILSSNLHN